MISHDLLQKISDYEHLCSFSYEYLCSSSYESFIKIAKIRKLPNGKYRVLSQKGKNLGTYTSHSAAKKRLSQIEMFKHIDENNTKDDKNIIDLTDIDDFSYSAIMRKLNQKATKEQVTKFLQLFKQQFDKAVKNKVHKPERIALQNTVVKYNKFYPIKLDNKLIKVAAISELGNAQSVGKYLSDIVKFIITRLPLDKRPHALQVLKNKFATMSESEISSKKLPQAAAYGQAITFVKHVLFNQDGIYVRETLDSLSRNL